MALSSGIPVSPDGRAKASHSATSRRTGTERGCTVGVAVVGRCRAEAATLPSCAATAAALSDHRDEPFSDTPTSEAPAGAGAQPTEEVRAAARAWASSLRCTRRACTSNTAVGALRAECNSGTHAPTGGWASAYTRSPDSDIWDKTLRGGRCCSKSVGEGEEATTRRAAMKAAAL
jgi:hypothetical protein